MFKDLFELHQGIGWSEIPLKKAMTGGVLVDDVADMAIRPCEYNMKAQFHSRYVSEGWQSWKISGLINLR